MLDHREVKGGSNREAGPAKSLRLQSLTGAPSVENGDTSVSQVLGDLSASQILVAFPLQCLLTVALYPEIAQPFG